MGLEDKRVVIGYIDERNRIAAEEQFFLLEQKRKNSKQEIVWIGKHYFSCFADLLKFYVRVYLRSENKLSTRDERTMLQLLDQLVRLESKIGEVSNVLQEKWKIALELTKSENSKGA